MLHQAIEGAGGHQKTVNVVDLTILYVAKML